MSDFEFAPTDVKPKRGRPVKLDIEVTPDGDKENTEKVEAPKPEWAAEELLQIFDDIIFAGEYSEDVSIKGRLKIRFRTRSTKEVETISRILDSSSLNLIQTMEEARFLLHLQYSLVNYNGKDLEGMKVDERAIFIRSLPGPVIGLLMGALDKFDRKVFAACKETEENF